jgi:SET domain-containing protein
MFIVKTYLGASPIHGVGVFAGEDIPAGAVVWRFHKKVDRVISQEDYEALPDAARREVSILGWREHAGFWVLTAGHDCFLNHSDNANLTYEEDRWDAPTIAARRISYGEELTHDYAEFDPAFKGF